MNDSKKLKIQRFLATGAALTPLSALRKYGCLSLSQRIGQLKREGWPIQSKMIRANGAKYKKYWIDVERVSL